MLDNLKKPVAIAVAAGVAGHSFVYSSCEDGQRCAKAKAVSITGTASAGPTSLSTTDFFVQNLIIGPAVSARPIKKPDWFQK